MRRILPVLFALTGGLAAAGGDVDALRTTVEAHVGPLMQKDQIPGMAVAIVDGTDRQVFTFGLASRVPAIPVTEDTLFEVGSISKTFTATLACLAEARHELSLSDTVADRVPELKGTAFGRVPLYQLATHTPGGLPLQVPEALDTQEKLMAYFRAWKPAYPLGTRRTYSNLGIGMLGLATARVMGETFGVVADETLIPLLGLHHTFVRLPPEQLPHYAWGYSRADAPTRLQPDVLSEATYGIKSTAGDLGLFLQEMMGSVPVAPELRQALDRARTGHFRVGPMTQDLIWEQYPYPVSLAALREGNGESIIFDPTPAVELHPPLAPLAEAWVNKTGSTNGFGGYVAFIPSKHRGIVLLANRNYPIPDRVEIAYKILEAVDRTRGQ